ncbi:baculoviral IAP repeat-containing protein 7-like isoform X1 [Oncorhynchus keta]|uniref:baculoviral IAP repeat-containing protein 7-like isoform X1 n=1 Tax=Oncorhynchus keta TaxID=8018 RepID=UPI0015FCA893|nr:baculoviral IAP repeat-containing protein 7-like isoform X1 [Oncorhynchus keta]XP_035616882.1 baculoviral IAP repeat-containing protein 7-like isoform X1 [Oncorhynchus keta]XP_035616885.1 baculoviral IAP repeat-containing protein 7-like isoform X1 [Oncorhynchus keta]
MWATAQAVLTAAGNICSALRASRSHLHSPLWNGTGMTATGPKEKEETTTPSMTDDRSEMMYILETPQMRGEEERLRTFENWPDDAPVNATNLARAGFFFLGPDDKVKCFCCGGILRYWVHGDSPIVEHKRHFPTCSLVMGRAVGNIPLYVVPGSPSDSVDGQLLSQLQRMTVDDQGAAGQAVYPEMESEESRLTTFHNWPTGAAVQPDVLSRAGFFYTGHGDNVKCFYCDGGLRNWEPGDDPWQEHAKWFPRCDFLIQTRGRDYVSNTQDTHFNRETVGVSQTPVSREINSENDVVGGLGVPSAMLSPVIQTVLQMGFEADLVESLVQTKYLLNGQHYTSVSGLVTDILAAEEEDRTRRPQSRGQSKNGLVERHGLSAGGVRTQAPIREKAVGDPTPDELLRQLQEERTCKVCMDKRVSIVFIPCGHLVVCSDCAASLRHCPICRATIRGSVRAFMS